jgi:hypothetical protein
MALELRGVRLRRVLGRKKAEGCARDAMRRIEVDDIGKGGCLEVDFEDFRGASIAVRSIFRELQPIALALIGYVTCNYY